LHVVFTVPRPPASERERSARRRRAILRAYLTAVEAGVDWSSQRYRDLEARFVMIAADYAAEQGISTEAWLLFGVPRRVLSAAGIAEDPAPEHEVLA
jgi:hypothetical protein